jgi:hypothetical protein
MSVPIIPVKATASEVADLIEDSYGVPRSLLDELAERVVEQGYQVLVNEVGERCDGEDEEFVQRACSVVSHVWHSCWLES